MQKSNSFNGKQKMCILDADKKKFIVYAFIIVCFSNSVVFIFYFLRSLNTIQSKTCMHMDALHFSLATFDIQMQKNNIIKQRHSNGDGVF